MVSKLVFCRTGERLSSGFWCRLQADSRAQSLATDSARRPAFELVITGMVHLSCENGKRYLRALQADRREEVGCAQVVQIDAGVLDGTGAFVWPSFLGDGSLIG